MPFVTASKSPSSSLNAIDNAERKLSPFSSLDNGQSRSMFGLGLGGNSGQRGDDVGRGRAGILRDEVSFHSESDDNESTTKKKSSTNAAAATTKKAASKKRSIAMKKAAPKKKASASTKVPRKAAAATATKKAAPKKKASASKRVPGKAAAATATKKAAPKKKPRTLNKKQLAATRANAVAAHKSNRKYPVLVHRLLMNGDKSAPDEVVNEYPEVTKLKHIASWHRSGMKMRHPLALVKFLGLPKFRDLRKVLRFLGFEPQDASLFHARRSDSDKYKTGKKSSIWNSTAGFCCSTDPEKWIRVNV